MWFPDCAQPHFPVPTKSSMISFTYSNDMFRVHVGQHGGGGVLAARGQNDARFTFPQHLSQSLRSRHAFWLSPDSAPDTRVSSPLSCHLETRVALCGAPGLLSLLSPSRLSYLGHFLGTSVAFGGCPEPQSPTQGCWKEQLRERAAPAWSGIGVSLALGLATALS